ncbi:hypothetical protein [Mesorhizobium sp. WSM4904]|uniref:hypothetical protein n=1 Tax=Mesorhizobium sp. WSM4904 TaxID=3038545 RepID=UPI002418155B|nr:hypothetical protein [Mesorhizobium sp. WSM4904]WFP63022.1 hypothetical protein QAZ47_00085 [Mesorhizobium sp. WSM4904]
MRSGFPFGIAAKKQSKSRKSAQRFSVRNCDKENRANPGKVRGGFPPGIATKKTEQFQEKCAVFRPELLKNK